MIWRTLLVTAGALMVAAVLTFLALWRVPGVHCVQNNCSTIFEHWWAVVGLLVLAVPVWWLARRTRALALVVLAVAVGCQFAIARVVVHRYVVSDFADGLENFAYVYAFFLSMVYVTVALVAINLPPLGVRPDSPAYSSPPA